MALHVGDIFSSVKAAKNAVNCFMHELGARTQEIDPGSFLVLENTEDGRFSRFYLTPNATILAVPYLQPSMALNACHCLSRYRQTLLIAVGIDGNNQIVPLTLPLRCNQRWRGVRSFVHYNPRQ
jgi:hypothetical protein